MVGARFIFERVCYVCLWAIMKFFSQYFNKDFFSHKNENYSFKLTAAYIIALSLIAILTYISHLFTNEISDTLLSRTETTYKLRSQTALILDISSSADNYFDSSMEYDLKSLNQSIDKLASLHAEVSDYLKKEEFSRMGDAQKTLYKYYFSDQFNLSRKVSQYIDNAREFSSYSSTSESPERKTVLEALSSKDQLALIDLINAAQSDFQEDTIGEIDNFTTVQMYVSRGIILVILLEALFIFRPIIRKLDQFHTTIISQALEDPLTKLGNRRYFHKTCQSYFDVAQREKKYFIVAICDLDKFKSVNDTYGHEVGDEVLKDFANLLKKTLRPFDVVARLGGEEFAIILANTNPKSAQLVFDRLLDVIRNNTCRYTLSSGKKGSLKYTTSIGYTVGNPQRILKLDKYLHDADLALYRAKQDGRDRAVSYQIIRNEMGKSGEDTSAATSKEAQAENKQSPMTNDPAPTSSIEDANEAAELPSNVMPIKKAAPQAAS